MPYSLVHCADVHLETTFAELLGGARRRAALADAFVRIVDYALAERADALTVGGDLYESQRAGAQTARFLNEQFARFGKPVFIAPGNHDPYAPSALYARADLPPNVRVFNEAAWSAVPLSDGVTLFGFGHTPAEPGPPFASARFDRGGVQIALVHGSDVARCPPRKRATAPFALDEIARSGTNIALVGHYHGGYVAREGATSLGYPGSPEPIRFGETGNHGVLHVRIDGANVNVKPVELAITRLLELTCDLNGAASEPAVLSGVERTLQPLGANDFVRLRLTGETQSGTRVDPKLLGERYAGALGALDIVDETRSYDYATIAREPTVRGRVVADLLALAVGHDTERAADAQRALRYALAAFDGSDIAP